jgi:hypothetical protein
MGESKLGDIYLEKDESVCRALWRPLDGPPDGPPEVLLCSIHLGAYERHPAIREAFAVLAADVAANLDRPAGAGISVQRVPVRRPTEAKIDRSQFACWTCQDPRARDARQCLSAFSDADLQTQLSPRGNPLFCCRISLAAVAR